MTTKDSIEKEASLQLSALAANPYPGRGLIIGMDETGSNLVQVYWIMGRSENSRNRVFSEGGNGQVFTEPVDPSKLKDPSLIIYNAMLESGDYYVVSNGSQTDQVTHHMDRGETFMQSLRFQTYEPDSPNFTPRITGLCSIHGLDPVFDIAIIRKTRWDNNCEQFVFHYDRVAPGFGFGITTYTGNGEPLPSFRGEPFLVPLRGSIVNVARLYWDVLNRVNRVALAIKFIPIAIRTSTVHIINEYTKANNC